MASPSPAQDIKNKSKLPQYGARNSGLTQTARDKPLFTSMRRAQFQQEFTTDSLNNTAIGSPSPAKPLHKLSNGTDRPARGIGLGAAFRRVDAQSKNEENKEVSAPNNRRGNGKTTRPTLPRQHVTEMPTSSPKDVVPRTRSKTPSPPRQQSTDFLLSPMSEVSESSPPREFAEAYKQINDQEDLAAFEDDLDSGDDTEDVVEESDLLRPEPRSSRQSSRRRSPGVDDAIILDTPELEQPETTQASILSSPSDPEVDASQLSRHQRDLRRIQLALGETKAFSKASRRLKPGAIELQHDDTNSRSGSHSESSNTSGSIVSDGSLNIPKTWGRKARHGKTWLSRLERDLQSETVEEDVFNTWDSKLATRERKPVEDWQAEASMTPLPRVQDQDSLEHSPSPAPNKPASLTARDRVRKLAFGEDKFLTKTQEEAFQRARNPALTLIREREIENLAKSAVTTNRLGELKERRSLERVGSRPATSGSEVDHLDSIKLDREPIVKSRPPQPLFDAVSVEKSEDPDLKDSTLPAILAANEIVSAQDVSKAHTTSKERQSEFQTPMALKATKPQTYLKTPLVTGAWIDTPLPAVKTEPINSSHGVAEAKEVISKTPEKVDVAKPAVGKQETADTQAREDMLKATAPKLPGSALAAIITHAKDKKGRDVPAQGEDTLQLDDSTILSLEEFVASGEDSDSESTKSDDDRIDSNTKPKWHRPTTSRFDREASDSEAEVPLTTRLRRLSTSAKDARKGLRSIEKHISRLPGRSTSNSSSRAQSLSRAQSECEEAGEFHDFIWPCEKCGHKAGSTLWDDNEASLLDWQWRPIQIYMPKLWFWPSSTSIFPQLTRLGWWSLLCATLLLTEIVLHEMYSPPFYASSMSGYGVDVHAPRPPFVLPKLIWNNSLSSPFDSLRFVLQIFVRFFASILGVDPGSFAVPGGDTADSWSSKSYVYSTGRGGGSPARFDADTFGMDADEHL